MRLPFSSPFLLCVPYLFMSSIYIHIRCAHSDQWLQRPLGWHLQPQPSLWMYESTVYWTSCLVGLHPQLTLITSKIHSALASSTTKCSSPGLSTPGYRCNHLYSFSGSNFIHLSLSHIQCRGQTTLVPSPKSTLSAHMLWRSVIWLFLTSWTGMFSWWEYWAAISSSRGAWRPRDRTHVSCIPALQANYLLLSHWGTGEASLKSILNLTISPHFSPTLDQALIRLNPPPLTHFLASTLAP